MMNMLSSNQHEDLDDGTTSEASTATLCRDELTTESSSSSPTYSGDELDLEVPFIPQATDLTEILLRDIDSHPAFPASGTRCSAIVDLTGDELDDDIIVISDQQSCNGAQIISPPLLDPINFFEETNIYRYGYHFVVGMSVSLRDGSFLHIESMLRDRIGAIFLKGRSLKKLNELGCEFPDWNELCWVVDHTNKDFSAIVPLEEVKELATICFTNERRYTEQTTPPRESHVRRGQREMICRLKQIIISKTEMTLMYLAFNDCDEENRVDPRVLRTQWRGSTPKFGSHTHRSSQGWMSHLPSSRSYTFGDGFCGAGGVSCGVEQAGVHIQWAFDKNPEAAITYRSNFPDAICETADVFDFLTNSPDDLRVDLTHSSPPCQTFSPAHTVNSAHDDDNSAPIFSSWNLLQSAKPRVHTMEETSGLLEMENSRLTFYRVIHDLIELGYSVQYKIVQSADYGIPQIRRRLVLIASGPGEVLPSFPAATHGELGSELLPFCTIHDAISDIPATANEHEVRSALVRGNANGQRPPYTPHSLARTITCGGGEGNYHPSGLRCYTNRELACLQTFPLSYQFAGRGVRKQIGNAVPPLLAKVLYQSIIQSLRETDERELAEAND